MNEAKKSIPFLYKVLPPFLLSAITAAVYYPSLHYAFQFDDVANIQKHFAIRHYSFSNLFFSGSRWISYWLNSIHYSIGRFDPFSYRVGNVMIHTANGLLIFFVLLVALSHIKKENFFKQNAFAVSLTTALLFLLHPVQTQTVSYVIQGQLEGLAMLFTLALSLCFLHMTYATKILKKVLLTQLFFALGILACGTKEIVIVTPVLIGLVDWFFVAQGEWSNFKKRIWIHASFFTMIIGMYLYLLKPKFFMDLFGFKMAVKNHIVDIITTHREELITPLKFYISQIKVILHYLWMLVWPFDISVEYDSKLCRSFFAMD